MVTLQKLLITINYVTTFIELSSMEKLMANFNCYCVKENIPVNQDFK